MAEADQERALLDPASEGVGRSRGRGAAACHAAGLAVGLAVLLAAAYYVSTRSAGEHEGGTRRTREAVSLEGKGITNLNVVLSNLPHRKLSADAFAKDMVEDSVSFIFEGAESHCRVDTEIVANQTHADATVVQVTLMPPGDKKGDDVACFAMSDAEKEKLVLLLADAMAALPGIVDISTGEVTATSISKAAQDDTAADETAQAFLGVRTTTRLKMGIMAGLAAIIVCAVICCICCKCKASGKPATAIADEGHPTRKDLIRRVFKRFDSDRDEKLNEEEMLVFVKFCCNFDGDSKDWAARYPALCEQFDVPLEQGFDAHQFEVLVDDKEVDLTTYPDRLSTYCSDDILKWVLKTDGVFPPGWVCAADPPHGIWM